MNKFLVAAFAALFVLGLSACEQSTDVEADSDAGMMEEIGAEADSALDATGDAMGAVGSVMGDAADAVGEAATDATDATTEAASEAADATVDAVDAAGDAVSDVVDGD